MGAKNLGSIIAFRGGLRKRTTGFKSAARRPNLPVLQPGRDSRPNDSKENQTKRLAFPWIHLAKLGLFNGLQEKK
jgi:hypothetical protein